MLNKVTGFIRRYQMLSPGDAVICAVSGGADSMALLWVMYLLRDKLKITLSAAHFNHGLRGEESDRDEAFVRQFCADYQIPFVCGRENVVSGNKGLEAAARDARYAFLRSLPGKIATAHTADDNAETLLLHLVRGTGLRGLGGITPVNGNVIRPMLTVTREEVLDLLTQYSIPYMEDSTNAGDDFLRNRLRHHVMPLLRQENPNLSGNLTAMALRLRRDEEALVNIARENKTNSVDALRHMEPAVRSRILSGLLSEAGVKEPESEHIAAMEKLVFSEKPSARASFPGNITVNRIYDELEVSRGAEAIEAAELTCPGELHFPGLRITCRPNDSAVQHADDFSVLPQGKIWVRPRIAGDTIRLSGGTKNIKKLYIDAKIPASRRMQIPVIADGCGVLGVVGFGAHLDRLSDGPGAVRIRFEPTKNKNWRISIVEKNIQKVLLSEEQIQAKVQELAAVLAVEYADKDPVFVGVLKGVVIFFADMVRKINIPCEIDFMCLSSYGGTNSTGNVAVKKDLSVDIKDRHVVILEDIYDTGNSLDFLYKYLKGRNPASLKICTLLDKPERRKPGITLVPDYIGFTIPNEFVVGYGLDFNEHYRNLPYIGVLKPEAYEN